MSSTTAILGWPYPDPSDTGDVPYWMQQLAEAIEASVVAADKRGVPKDGSARLTASSAATSGTGSVNVLTITTTLTAGRRYKLVFDGMVASSVAGDRATVSLLADGATIKTAQSEQLTTASSAYAISTTRMLTCADSGSVDLASGSHTFQLAIARLSGTGAINVVAGTATPAQFWIEDAGPYRT